MDFDKEIFTAIIQDDQNAFEDLFQKYYELLCTYALTYLDDVNEVEDVVQNVFVYVWNYRKSIKIESSVKAYLYSSVKHMALNILKHKAVERNHSHLLIEFWEDLSREEYSEGETVQLAKIRQALEILPFQCRTVFMMSCLDGKKYREIAEELHISVNTVKSHIRHAYHVVREYVGEFKASSFFFFLTYKISLKSRH
mgnify:CR=1 FL=1